MWCCGHVFADFSHDALLPSSTPLLCQSQTRGDPRALMCAEATTPLPHSFLSPCPPVSAHSFHLATCCSSVRRSRVISLRSIGRSHLPPARLPSVRQRPLLVTPALRTPPTLHAPPCFTVTFPQQEHRCLEGRVLLTPHWLPSTKHRSALE